MSPPSAESERDQKGRTILIIEDDVNLLQLLELMLGRQGFSASLVSEPQEGLRRALEERPDIVIVDLMMPEMTGFEVIRRLRADPRGADLPILVLTARAQSLDRKAALAAGADAFLSKPVSARALLSQIEELLARARPQPLHAAGRVIVLLSLRGGVGVTTLAVNLALLLQRAPQGACLVDLDRSGGHVMLSLKAGFKPDLPATAHWGALLEKQGSRGAGEQGEASSPAAVMDLLVRHESGLRILPAPPDPVQGAGLPLATALAALRTLRSEFNFAVVDAGPALDEPTLAALALADGVLLVFAPEVSSVHTTAATLRALAGTAVDGHISLVMNHPSSLRPLPQAGLERSLGRPITMSMPFDENQILALARGVPLLLGSTPSPLVKAIRDLAVHIVEHGA